MLQRRRIFDITNMITNYTFMVCLLLCALYAASLWFSLDAVFLDFIVNASGVLACSVAAASAALFIVAVVFWILDGHPRVGLALWSLLRGAICLALMVAVYTFATVTTTGLEVRL